MTSWSSLFPIRINPSPRHSSFRWQSSRNWPQSMSYSPSSSNTFPMPFHSSVDKILSRRISRRNHCHWCRLNVLRMLRPVAIFFWWVMRPIPWFHFMVRAWIPLLKMRWSSSTNSERISSFYRKPSWHTSESCFSSFLSTIFVLSASRVRDLHAVVDLSMYNYLEMSHLVTQRSFLWRKKLDSLLYRLIPKWWIPLYTMVTFTRIPYSKCVDFRQRQDRILKILRFIGYSIVGSYLFKQFALYVIKPFAIKLVAHRYLPTVVANQVVGEWEVFQINANLAWTCDDVDVIDRYVRS